MRGSCVTRPVDPPSGVRIARRLRPEGAVQHGQVAAERCSHDSGTTGRSRMRNEQCPVVASPHVTASQCASRKRSHAPTAMTRFRSCHSFSKKFLLHARQAHLLSAPALSAHVGTSMPQDSRQHSSDTSRCSAAGLPCEAARLLQMHGCSASGTGADGVSQQSAGRLTFVGVHL